MKRTWMGRDELGNQNMKILRNGFLMIILGPKETMYERPKVVHRQKFTLPRTRLYVSHSFEATGDVNKKHLIKEKI